MSRLIKDIVAERGALLKRAGKDSYILEAQLMACEVLGCDRLRLVTNSGAVLSDEQIKLIDDMVQKRLGGMPLQYILGRAEFMSLPFCVTEDVLIPRQETELLVETVTRSLSGGRILDLCTGSGCIGVSLAHYMPNAFVDALDVSSAALKIARKNAEEIGVASRMRFICDDILKNVPKEKYDAVVSNPPYIESEIIGTLQQEVRDFEPRVALDGGNDGLLFYRRIAEIMPDVLKQGGVLALEIGEGQREAVVGLIEGSGVFGEVAVYDDLAGIPRVVLAKRNE